MTNKEAAEMIRNDMKLHHDYLSGQYRKALNMAINALLKEQKEIEPMKVTYLYTELQDKLVQMMAEYLCEDHTEKELMELVEKAIKYSDGEKISS